jgi:2-polyprenyl-3-methyl-5-hydroxy-6-metoxy-1,4-benzoquinol methylase
MILTDAQDAQGHGMYDYWKGISSSEIVERDDGYIEASGYRSIYFAEYTDWWLCEKEAISYAQKRVLDIGCGAGRVLLYLKRQGIDALGIDNSPMAIKTCRERGLENAQLVPITKVNKALGAFDTIIMYGNNFGLFSNYRRARTLLRRFHRMTTADGRIIAETLDPYQTNLPEHLEYHRRNKERGRMGGQVRIRVRYRKYKTPYFDYLFVSRDEMRDLLAGTGWDVKRFIDCEGPVYLAIIEKE